MPSGSTVIVTGVGQLYFQAEQTSALAVKYTTDVSLSSDAALKIQAREFLNVWKPDLDKSGFKYGAIMAQEPPQGFIFTVSEGRNFVAEKGSDGTWTLK